jgi:enoyl-CoA hydratase/carnithine racemase
MTTQVKLTTDGSLARICFEADNGIQLLTRDVREGLRGILDELELRPQISVVLFEAKGRVFIAGADINELLALTAETAADNSREGQAMMSRIEKLPATTVIAMHAACAGGGCELALACDMRIASDSAVIGLPETRIGIFPGWGGTVRATRVLGSAVALRMILSGELLPAQKALQLGLVDDVSPDDSFRDVVEARVQTLLARGPFARAQAKKLVRQFEGPDSAAQFEAEALAFAECYRTGEPQIGMQAFLEKRDAQWP